MGFERLMLLALLATVISHGSTMRAGAALPSGVDASAANGASDTVRAGLDPLTETAVGFQQRDHTVSDLS